MTDTDLRQKSDAPSSPPIAGSDKPQPITTLRDWLDHLAARDRLAVIRPEISLHFELAAIAKRFDGHKATLFPHPGGHAMPVISGLLSDRQWIADAMGVDLSEVLARFQDAALNPLPWKEVKSAPVQEIVHHEVNLGKQLPLPTHNEYDSGPYITAGLLITRNPVSGVQNVSIHRLQLSDFNRLGVLLLPRHTHMFYEMAESSGDPLDVAIVIGVDPLTLLSSQAIAPIDFDELTIAGALHGAPLPVVKCLTSELRVPAEAEIVVEGRLLPNVRELEGPFGEFPQYYGEPAMRHVIEVAAVMQRRDAIFHTIVGGGLEALMLGAIPRRGDLAGASTPQLSERAGRASRSRWHLSLSPLCPNRKATGGRSKERDDGGVRRTL